MVRHAAASALAGLFVIAASTADAVDVVPRQVQIEARILSIDEDTIRELPAVRDPAGLVNRAPGVVGIARQPGHLLQGGGRPDVVTIDDAAAAIRQSGLGDLLANPEQTAGFGQPVTFGEIERIEVLRGGTSAVYGDAGLTLNVIPRWQPDGMIVMDLGIDSIIPEFVGDDVLSTRRHADSMVRLRDGETVVIGGFFGDSARESAAKIPLLGDVPFIGRLFGSRAFHTGSTDPGLLVTPTVLGDGPTAQVRIEAHLLELDLGYLQSLDIDFADGLPDSDLSQISIVLPASGLRLPGSGADTDILAAPRITTDNGKQARIEVGDEVRVPLSDGGTMSFSPGLSLNLTPYVLDTDNLRLDVDYAGGYPTLPDTRGAPRLEVHRAGTSVMLRDGQTVVIGGLFGPGAGAAARRIPLLGDLPTLGPAFRQAADDGRNSELVIMVTPRLILSDGEGSGSNGSASVANGHERAPLAPGEISIDAGAGYGYQALPTFGWARLEFGSMIQVRPIVEEDADVSGTEFRVGLSTGLSESFLGGRFPKLGLDLRYLDAEADSFTQLIPSLGNDLGVESPQGTGILVPSGFGSDLGDVRFRLDYEDVDATIKLSETFTPFSNKAAEVYGGLNIGYSSLDSTSSFLTNSFFNQFERQDRVSTWTIGPVIGLSLSHNYGALTSFGGLEIGGGIGIADGWSGTFLDMVPFGERDLTETDFIYSVGASAGVRYQRDNWNVELSAEFSFDNHNAVFIYQPFDPATLEFKSDAGAFIGLSAGYTFGG